MRFTYEALYNMLHQDKNAGDFIHLAILNVLDNDVSVQSTECQRLLVVFRKTVGVDLGRSRKKPLTKGFMD